MILSFIQNVAILAAVVVVLSEYLSRLTKADGFWAQFQTWVVAFIVALIANVLGLGFGSASWFTDALLGVFIGLVANGIFNIPFTQTVLVWIKARI